MVLTYCSEQRDAGQITRLEDVENNLAGHWLVTPGYPQVSLVHLGKSKKEKQKSVQGRGVVGSGEKWWEKAKRMRVEVERGEGGLFELQIIPRSNYLLPVTNVPRRRAERVDQ